MLWLCSSARFGGSSVTRVMGVKCITGVVGMAARPGPTDATRKVLLSQGLSGCPAPRISGIC